MPSTLTCLTLALLSQQLLSSLAVAQTSGPATTTVVMETTTTAMGGFTSEQLGVLIGIPVALLIIILIGVIIGCVVQHKVNQEDKLLEGKPYGSEAAGASSLGRNPVYYADYLNSQTKSQ